MTNDPRALSTLSSADYEAIEQAVMETARGRWFLREYAARNRNADTTVLLEAIGRLESAVGGERAMEQVERVRFDLLEMAKSIAGLKIELEASDQNHAERTRFGVATTALDAIVRTTEKATSSILESTEAIQEIAWDLREQQFDEKICDRVDRLATEIYTACSFQDLTAQRTQKVVQTLRFLEGRINALIDLWSGKERSGPDEHETVMARAAERGVSMDLLPMPHDLSQSDVDSVIVDEHFAAAPDIPDHVREALVMHETAADMDSRQQVQTAEDNAHAAMVESVEEHADLMASDEPTVIIDDDDLLDLDFVLPDDMVEDGAAPAPSPEEPAVPEPRPAAKADASPSLAQVDAMPTTAKALLFG